jgi:hypothetical protein
MSKKLASIGAALILAAAASSTPAQAQHRGGAGVGGAHFGGAHIGGAPMGGAHFGAARIGGAPMGIGRIGGAPFGAARIGAPIGARITAAPFGGQFYRGTVGPGRYGYYGFQHRGYWPYLGLGAAAAALVSAWPYAYDYGYDDYGYEAPAYVAPAYDNDVAYCMQRFRSYDPASRTYLGYDGYRHPCP